MRCGIISSCQSAATFETVQCSRACVHREAVLHQVPDLYLLPLFPFSSVVVLSLSQGEPPKRSGCNQSRVFSSYVKYINYLYLYLGKYNRSEIKTLHVGSVWWDTDAHCVHPKNLRPLSWMDVITFSGRVCHQHECHCAFTLYQFVRGVPQYASRQCRALL